MKKRSHVKEKGKVKKKVRTNLDQKESHLKNKQHQELKRTIISIATH